MKKKPFWRRANRGFVVSMALLGIVLVYVIVTQLMMIPAKQNVKKLTNDYRSLMESTSQLSDEQIKSLKDDKALGAEQNRLKGKLSELFVKDSGYLDSAVQSLMSNIQVQTEGSERITSREAGKLKSMTCRVDQDVATCSVEYSYKTSGDFMNYRTDEMNTQTDVEKRLIVSVTCKKVDGEWKIYRVARAEWQLRDDHFVGVS